MDNSTIQHIKETIAQSSSIGIAAPNNPTMDEMAAATALYLILKNANKNVTIASPSDPIVEVSSLVGIDKVQKTLEGSGGNGDLTVSFPYTEGEIEKVSYTLEEGYLNIIVKASEQGLSFDEKDVEFARGGGTLDLVFTVGVARLTDLSRVFDTQNPDIRIINIDNKEENENYGDIVLVSPKLSSISEGVADLAVSLGLHIDEDSAQNLLSGISSATQNFQNPRTSSLAFEMVALLMKKGAARETSASARRGIRVDDRAQQRGDNRPQTQNAPQRQAQDQSDNAPVRQAPRSDRRSFEETLQKRVAEEQAREDRARQAMQARQGGQSQVQQPTNDDYQDDLPAENDEAPSDWLAPKVYKGSSEV
jgi:hypothetical protein